MRPTADQHLGDGRSGPRCPTPCTSTAEPPPRVGAELAQIDTVLPWFTHERARPLPLAARPGAVHRRCLGHPRRLPGAGRAADRARPSRGAARVLLGGSCAPRTRAVTGRRPSTSSRRSPSRASRTPTATSSTGRCSPSASTCAPPATRRCSTSGLPFVGDRRPDAHPRPSPTTCGARWTASRRCTVPGTALPAYGHGDWNDSLQPADPDLAARPGVDLDGRAARPSALRTAGRRAGRPAEPLPTAVAAGPHDGRRRARTPPPARLLAATGCCPATCSSTTTAPVEPLVHPRDDPDRADLQHAADDPRDRAPTCSPRSRPSTTSTSSTSTCSARTARGCSTGRSPTPAGR